MPEPFALDIANRSEKLSSAEISKMVREILATGNPAIPENLGDDVNLFDQGWIDSFAIVNLVVGIEERCRIVLTEDDLTEQNLASVNDIVRLISGKRREA